MYTNNYYNITRKSKGVYEIECNIEHKECKILIKINRGPRDTEIYDDNGNNITNIMIPFINYKYLGFVPKYYNYKYIKVVEPDQTDRIISDKY